MSEEIIDKIKSTATIIVLIAGLVLIIAGLTTSTTEYEDCVSDGKNEYYCFRTCDSGWGQKQI